MSYTTNKYMPRIRRDAADLVRRGWSTRKVARHFGFSQSVIVKWVKKAKTWGYGSIPTQSSRPKHHPKQLGDELIWKIFQQRIKNKRCAEVVHQELINQGIKTSLQSDHGPEFSRWFTSRIQKNHRYTRIGKPNDNAHIERFNRTLQEECIDKVPRNVRTINCTLEKYLQYYNHERLHLGLKLKTLSQFINKVIPSY